MSIAGLLGFENDRYVQLVAEGEGGFVLDQGDQPQTARLHAWHQDACPVRVNRFLSGLARLAAADGGDVEDAARLLAWLMLPAALRLRQELSWVKGPVDESIAAQLWLEVRTVPWWRPHRVAPRIAWRLRDAVRRDLSLSTRDHVIDLPLAELPERPDIVEESPDEELADVLDWAIHADVITEADRELLERVLSVIRQLDDAGESPRSNTSQGLGGDRVAALVAEQIGVNMRTVRRRTAKAIAALSAHAPRYFDYLAA